MGKRGPKPFSPTKQQRDLVQLWVAGGVSQEVIAHKLGISQDTLADRFQDELSFGAQLKKAENLELLGKAAKAGNVSAMKHLDAKFEVAGAKAEFLGERAPKVGKKELVRAEALTAGRDSDWGDDLKTPDVLPN